MLISEALGGSKDLDVHFDTGSVLHIRYRPTSYTVAQLQELEAGSRKDPTRIIDSVLEIVETWDLQRPEIGEEGEPTGQRVPVALTPEDVRIYVNTKILGRIIRSVNEDQSAGE